MRKTKYIDEEFPELVQCFVNQSDSHISTNSKKMCSIICPCCHKIHTLAGRTIALRENTYCSKCNDNYSYPERFMSAVLDELKINYINQYTDIWTKKFRYDFKFSIHNVMYIVETDGDIGHGRKSKTSQMTPEESIARDREKDLLARKNGYVIIRVDCKYGNTNKYQYIKNQILKSELNTIFDFSCVDWDKCNRDATSSRKHEIINAFNNGEIFLNELSSIFHLSMSSIKNILSNAMKDGLVKRQTLYKFNPFEKITHPVISDKKYWGGKMTMVYCYEDALIFGTTYDADDYYGFPKCSVRNAINSSNGFKHDKHFVHYNDLPKDFDFKPYFFPDEEYRQHAYCQWKDGELLNIYFGKNNLPPEFKYGPIIKAITGQHKTMYGYQWSILPKEIEYQYLQKFKDGK